MAADLGNPSGCWPVVVVAGNIVDFRPNISKVIVAVELDDYCWRNWAKAEKAMAVVVRTFDGSSKVIEGQNSRVKLLQAGKSEERIELIEVDSF
jgi:hypothetical protein